MAGEYHNDDVGRAEFSKSLSLFQEAQGEVLALEMVETNNQKILDNYSSFSIDSDKKLYDYLVRRWGYNTDSYMQMISKARSLNLELLAVDLPDHLRPPEVMLSPVPPGPSLVRMARELHMAGVLCNNHKKTVLLIGATHIREEFLPSDLKKHCSLSPYTYRL